MNEPLIPEVNRRDVYITKVRQSLPNQRVSSNFIMWFGSSTAATRIVIKQCFGFREGVDKLW